MGHSTKPLDKQTITGLIEFATNNEVQCLRALLKHGTYRAAAKAMGKGGGAFNSAIRTVRQRAALRGFAPEHGWNPPTPRTKPAGQLPEGFEIAALTDQIGADGKRQRAWNKARLERSAAPDLPPGFLAKEITQAVGGDGKLSMQWSRYSPAQIEQWANLKAAVAELCKPLEGGGGCVEGPSALNLEDTLTVYGLGDPHHGMLSWKPETGDNFDLKISQDTTNAAVLRLLQAAPASRVGGLVLIGDNFHADDDQQVTPGHKHKLDVEGRAPKVWRTGCAMWRTQIDRMLEKHAEVRVWIMCGNHDPLTSFFLREWLACWYRAEPRVVVEDNIPEHQYFLFGKVLLGFTHGHKSKPVDLEGVMAVDVPQMWAAAEDGERHWFTGHIHSKTWWDLRGCSLESLRILAPADAWAKRNGYRSKRGSVAVTYHPELGEVSRATVGVR